MAFIKINPEGMLTVINNLDERASAVDTERTNIDNSSSDNHDPVTSVVTATDPLPAPLAPSQNVWPFPARSKFMLDKPERLCRKYPSSG